MEILMVLGIILATVIFVIWCLFCSIFGWPWSNWLSTRKYKRRKDWRERKAFIQEQERIREKYEKADN